MSATPHRPGELYTRNRTRLLDTREMEWEDDPEIGRIKVHGREPSAASLTGCVMLVWRSAPGNFVRERSAAGETVDVPSP